jgi:hypothetical protein
MFECPNPPTAEEAEQLRAQGLADAEKAMGYSVYSDGLGVLGCGSWRDGPASIKQAAFNERYRELHGRGPQ